MRFEEQNPEAHAIYLRTLSHSLHQMAQPLSTIQLTLELALLNATSIEQYRDAVEGVLADMRRVVDGLQFSRTLTRFQQPATDARPVSLSRAIENALSDLRCTLESSQLQIMFSPYDQELIQISPARLRQMLFFVLQAVQGSSQAGDVLTVDVQEAADRLVLRVRRINRRMGDGAVSDAPRDEQVDKALALAEAIVNSAGGKFMVTADPLFLVADFPALCESRRKSVESDISNTAALPAANGTR